jgi:hypothetical protein
MRRSGVVFYCPLRRKISIKTTDIVLGGPERSGWVCWYPANLLVQLLVQQRVFCLSALVPAPASMPLTDLKLGQLKPAAGPYRQSDGGGLFIEVRPGGSRLWRLAYRFGGKQKLLALGSYPETPLARARRLRQDARSQLQAGNDPAAETKAAAEAERAIAKDTFSPLAEELLAKQEREGKAATTLDKKRRLRRHLTPSREHLALPTM